MLRKTDFDLLAKQVPHSRGLKVPVPFSLKTFSESLVREKQRVLLASLIVEELDVLII